MTMGMNITLGAPDACPWCSSETSVTFHGGPCPRVKAIDYYPDGSIKRLEFHHEFEAPPHPPVRP